MAKAPKPSARLKVKVVPGSSRDNPTEDLSRSPLRIADAFIHIEPDRREPA